MNHSNLGNLLTFITIAREGTITRAAANLGLTQPSVSLTLKNLELLLGQTLFVRGARKLVLTDSGQRLFERLQPQFAVIESEINAVKDLNDKPTGLIRITVIDYALRSTLWPKLVTFMRTYPDIKVEIISEYAMVDIVSQGYDAGIRFGELLAQDMISIRIGPDIKNSVVCSKSYLAGRIPPKVPSDLLHHQCINLRLSSKGGLYAWEFMKGKKALEVKVGGHLTLSNAYDILDGALEGFGMAFLPEDLVKPFLHSGQLISVLEEWCPTWEGFHLYYPNRRQPSKAMTLLIDALRYQK